ncbi:MAG: autoinducer 2 ABC transporter substrate-binding protein [Ancalomicrobiaceae bacterium]|nr:autoinducer 2 ABC transporter substrate-binding protein [Ancalomicrobiaceae bacterium]
MRRRDVLSLAGAAGTLVAMGGLGFSVGAASAAETYTMAAIPKLRSPWFNQFEKGLLDAAKDFGVKAYQQAPSSADEAAQARLIEDAINQGINALLVVPNDAQSLVPVFKRAQDRKIVTLTHESPQQRNADFDVEMIDNKAFGRKSMDVLAEAIGPDGGDFVIYVGSLTVPAHNIWADAALAQAKEKYPKLKLLADRYPVSEDQSAARQTALDILTAHPTVKGFLCFGSQGAPGASQAVGEKSLNGKVAVVGTTSPNQASQYLKDGSMSAVILWDPGEAAYAMVYLAKLVLDGKKGTINADLNIPKLGKPLAIDKNTLVYDRPLIVTKANVDEHNGF